MSNNRVKSGYQNRLNAPIDMVPSAGARFGLPDGTDLTEPNVAKISDIEESQEEGAVPPEARPASR